jgi:hypothetical protein
MTFGASSERAAAIERPRLKPVLLYLAGIAGLGFSLAILWLTMRAVMGIGGSCASGGPYVPAVECPDAVVLLTPLSMFGLFIFLGLAGWGGAQLRGGWVGLLALGWPILFLSLGWNFLEFGLRPPGGEPGELVWSWLFCAVVFFLMGGVPLVGAIWGLREARASGRRAARGSGGSNGARSSGGAGDLRAARPARPYVSLAPSRYELHLLDRPERAPTATDDELDRRLERLARLHDAGDLTDAEFEAAKRATIRTAG